MEITKTSEILSALDTLDANSSESILKALAVAENEEKSAMNLYDKEKKKNLGNELESFFDFMYREETMHYAKIQELKKNVKDGSSKKITFEHQKHPIIHFKNHGSGEMTAVLFALWREKKAVEFYSGASAKTKGNVKAFFDELVKFERGHVEMLEEYVESMQNVGELIMG
ncbi:Uncharacterised protein [uncultured archaeon]|nr:Uncharacterised protein [uncultured archaeon]